MELTDFNANASKSDDKHVAGLHASLCLVPEDVQLPVVQHFIDGRCLPVVAAAKNEHNVEMKQRR